MGYDAGPYGLLSQDAPSTAVFSNVNIEFSPKYSFLNNVCVIKWLQYKHNTCLLVW